MVDGVFGGAVLPVGEGFQLVGGHASLEEVTHDRADANQVTIGADHAALHALLVYRVDEGLYFLVCLRGEFYLYV